MDMAYVKVYADWAKATAKLKDAEKGRLIDAMVVYATTGEDRSDSLSGNEQYLFPMFQASIDRDRQALDDYIRKQSENGSKGGRPRKNPPVFSENPKNPPVFSKTQKSQDKEKEKDKEEYTPPAPSQGATGGGSYVADNLRGMSAANWDELRAYMEDGISVELLHHAVDEACAHNKRTWGYTRRILDNYLTEGVTTVEEARQRDKPQQAQAAYNQALVYRGDDW